MISDTEYQAERAICDRAEAYARATMAGRNYLAAEEAQHPDYAACNNAMRGRVEQYELLRDMPDKFVAYLQGEGSDAVGASLAVTVWTGDRLGTARVRTVGRRRSQFGERQRYGRATINGTEYAWQGQGSGMYATFRKLKRA